MACEWNPGSNHSNERFLQLRHSAEIAPPERGRIGLSHYVSPCLSEVEFAGIVRSAGIAKAMSHKPLSI